MVTPDSVGIATAVVGEAVLMVSLACYEITVLHSVVAFHCDM